MADYIEYFGLPGTGKTVRMNRLNEATIEVNNVGYMIKLANLFRGIDSRSVGVLIECFKYKIRIRGLFLFLERYGRYKFIIRSRKTVVVDEGILQSLWASNVGCELFYNEKIRHFLSRLFINNRVKIISVSFETWLTRRENRSKIEFLNEFSNEELLGVYTSFSFLLDSLSDLNVDDSYE
jgi:hypothetical protein